VGSFGLGKFGFSLIPAAIAEDEKDEQGENSQKDHNDRDLDGNQQHATQRQELPKQRHDQKYECCYASDCFEK
jgi:hypothetical protein